MVMIADESKKMHEFMSANGYNCTPYTNIFDMTADAIYYLLGEDKAGYDTFDESFTWKVLHDGASSECKIASLLNVYQIKPWEIKTDPLS